MKLSVVLGKILPLGAACAVLAVVGCGRPNNFAKQTYNSAAVANQYTQPQIDILFVQDNSSSMAVPTQNIKSQLNSFITSLGGRWNYHFAVVPLQSALPLTSRAIIATDCSTIMNATCVPSAYAASFNSYNNNTGWITSTDTGTGNADLGFYNMQQNLSDPSMTNTGFLRPGAALAVVVLSNGDDITGINYPSDYYYLNGQSGYMLPNDSSPDAIASFNTFENFLLGIKGGGSLLKFYSVVAQTNYISSYSLCNGQYAWAGNRYNSMSLALNSSSDPNFGRFDICNPNALSSVLGSIANALQSLIQAYKFNYAVLNVTNGATPNPSSITVTKNGVTVPQDPNNGWTYVGYTSQYLSYYPQLSNYASGYMIQFHGNAVYSGTDQISVNFQTF